jgi:hypothetical protein
LGFATGQSSTRHQAIFLAPLLGRKRISARGVSRFQSFILLLFCFTLFLLASFYQKYKKISSYFKLLFMSSLVSIIMSPKEMIFTFKQKSEESFKEAWSRIYDCHGKTEPKMTLSFFLVAFTLVLLFVIDMIWML